MSNLPTAGHGAMWTLSAGSVAGHATEKFSIASLLKRWRLTWKSVAPSGR